MKREGWVSWEFDFVSLGQSVVGPFEQRFEALYLQQGQGSGLWIISEFRRALPYISLPPTASVFELWDIGFNLNRANLFLPARFDRWWILNIGLTTRRTRLHTLSPSPLPVLT